MFTNRSALLCLLSVALSSTTVLSQPQHHVNVPSVQQPTTTETSPTHNQVKSKATSVIPFIKEHAVPFAIMTGSVAACIVGAYFLKKSSATKPTPGASSQPQQVKKDEKPSTVSPQKLATEEVPNLVELPAQENSAKNDANGGTRMSVLGSIATSALMSSLVYLSWII